MGSKSAFLFSLRAFIDEIGELAPLAKDHTSSCERLSNRLDELCRFMLAEDNERLWRQWGSHADIAACCAELRGTAVHALSELEKAQAARTYDRKVNISAYTSILSDSAKEELRSVKIGRTSKVLFIGAGAFPLSAMTIAKETDAEVLCADIDAEAVLLGSRVIEAAGLHTKIHYSETPFRETAFLKEATHCIVASLVPHKSEVLAEWKPFLNSSSRVVLRYGNGLKSIFNYPLEGSFSNDWLLTPFTRSKSMYDILMLVSKESVMTGA
ncbi:hypothetical protein [Paenibacillus sp. MBLB4367]|uniref:hypothetical protein n=1 Tax=Paenibacillus sp. MBLB4367 TaxID=3384767 RepID=UPI003907FB08